MSLKRKASFFLDLLFPPRCIFCGNIVPPGQKICSSCKNCVTPINSAVRINAGPLGKNIPCAVLYSYADNVRRSIIRFKFYGEKSNASFYAEALSKYIRKFYEGTQIDTVTCVPISSERRKKRGYNQSELVARGIASILDIPYTECLVKVKDNAEQHFLGKNERLINVKGAYCHSGQDISGKSILIIDDIVTTGSTLSECCKVLLKSGAKVSCAALALAKM